MISVRCGFSQKLLTGTVCVRGLWWAHRLPLVADVLRAEVGVGVHSSQLDAVGLSDLHDLIHYSHGGHALLICLRESGLELIMSRDQTLMKEEGGRGAGVSNMTALRLSNLTLLQYCIKILHHRRNHIIKAIYLGSKHK